jgi:hypothetical protein
MFDGLEHFAKLAPAFLIPVTAIGVLITAAGVLVSLYIGICTLGEIRKGRQHSITPFCLFPTGAQRVLVEFDDSSGIPGIEISLATRLNRDRPPGKNRITANNPWGKLQNFGMGPAVNTKISLLAYRVFMGEEVFVVDESKRTDFPYAEIYNRIPAHPSHLAVGKEAVFMRLPTPIVVDFKRRMTRLDFVVIIAYRDLFGNSYQKFQGLRAFCNYLDDSSEPYLVLTFLEEMDPANPDFSIFGKPTSPPTNLPGFPDIHKAPEIAAP